jgi:hypothetical protein
MNYLKTKNLLRNSAAFKLFRKDYASFIISFLYTEFKLNEQLIVESDEFARDLADTIEEYKSEHLLENELLLSPEHYINELSMNGLMTVLFENFMMK